MGYRLDDSRYEEIKEEVVLMYEEIGINTLPIMTLTVAQKLGIKVKSYSELSEPLFHKAKFASNDGFVIIDGTEYTIYYNPGRNRERVRFTIMHEIGHIRLGHLIHDEENEAEANFFAAYALAANPLINVTNCMDENAIMQKFDVSFSVAQNALSRFRSWLQYGPENYTDYERRLLKLFENDLNKYRRNEIAS